jgi:transcriptional regulator with XRE-family HTH domain
MTPEVKRFAERMRAHRISGYWSMRDLARHAGLHYNYVARIEHGEQVPSLEVAARIARALKIKLGALTDESRVP